MMKKFTAILICLLMIGLCGAVCFADDLYIIDPYTGQAVSANSGHGTNSVRYSDRCIYDVSEDIYTYSVTGGTDDVVKCNVYDGMIVRGSVKISAVNPIMIDVYRDGVLVPEEEYANFHTPGNYIVRDLSNDVQLFGFTIVKQISGAVYTYRVPTPFDVYRVIFDGKPVASNGNVVSMSEEGQYYVEYGNYSTGNTYELELLVDHTAPELEISGVNESGIARNKVTFGKRESNSTLEITRNGEPFAAADELDQQGEYVVIYTDEAGNSSLYHITVRLFFDTSAKVFILMFLAVLAAAAAFMIYSRKNMRVR